MGNGNGTELWRHSALELGALIAKREVSSVEVTQAHLERMIERPAYQ